MAGAYPVGRAAAVPLDVVHSLLTRVIWQAVADLSTSAYRREAEEFFQGPAFEEYCEILGWNVRRARQGLNSFVSSGARISGNHVLPMDPVGLESVSGRRRSNGRHDRHASAPASVAT